MVPGAESAVLLPPYGANVAEKETVLINVRWMIDRLSRPLSVSDLQYGWIEESRLVFLAYFQDLEQKLIAEQPIPALNIPRGMDTWGILGGNLFQMAAEISVELPKLN